MLTMRTLDQPLAQLSSLESEADLGITVGPKDTKASIETAKVLQGLIASKAHVQRFTPEDDATYCYAVADAMIRARA